MRSHHPLFVAVLVCFAGIAVGHLVTAPGVSSRDPSSAPEMTEDPVGSDNLSQLIEVEDAMDLLDQLVKVVPRNVDQVPEMGLSMTGTDPNLMSKAGVASLERLELRATGNVANPRFSTGAPTYSRPEDGPVPAGEMENPLEAWATGKVRDGLLQKERPLPVPIPLAAQIRNVQDTIVSVQDTSDPAQASGVGPDGFFSGPVPGGQTRWPHIARGIVHRNHRMGNMGGNFETDKRVHGRIEWSYDPTIPNSDVSAGVDFSVDIDPQDHKGGKANVLAAKKRFLDNLARGRPFGHHPRDDDDPEDRI